MFRTSLTGLNQLKSLFFLAGMLQVGTVAGLSSTRDVSRLVLAVHFGLRGRSKYDRNIYA